MDVLLVRHATAIPALSRLSDEDRWLTDGGRATALRVGERLFELGIRPNVLYTSPLVRAVQTSELLARALSPGRVETHPPLAIDQGSVGEVIAVLGKHASTETIVLVTHEPKIRSIAAKLARSERFRGFATAECALFRGERDRLVFTWMLDPERLVTTAESGDTGA